MGLGIIMRFKLFFGWMRMILIVNVWIVDCLRIIF